MGAVANLLQTLKGKNASTTKNTSTTTTAKTPSNPSTPYFEALYSAKKAQAEQQASQAQKDAEKKAKVQEANGWIYSQDQILALYKQSAGPDESLSQWLSDNDAFLRGEASGRSGVAARPELVDYSRFDEGYDSLGNYVGLEKAKQLDADYANGGLGYDPNDYYSKTGDSGYIFVGGGKLSLNSGYNAADQNEADRLLEESSNVPSVDLNAAYAAGNAAAVGATNPYTQGSTAWTWWNNGYAAAHGDGGGVDMTGTTRTSGGSGGSGSSGGGSGYNAVLGVAKYNAQTIKDALADQEAMLNASLAQDRATADRANVSAYTENSRDRFERLKELQSSVNELKGRATNAMQGSAALGLLDSIRYQQDKDNANTWGSLVDNITANEEEYNAQANTTQAKINELYSNAKQSLRSLEGSLSADLYNQSNKYVAPGTGDANLGSSSIDTTAKQTSITPTKRYITNDNERALDKNLAPDGRPKSTAYRGRLIRNNYGY